MTKLVFGAAFGAACLALAGCGEREAADQNVTVVSDEVDSKAPAGGAPTSTTAFPRGARIVEEEGVTFRIDPDGTRIRLSPSDSRILVEDGVRFRVDPDGTRLRIDRQGATIDTDDVRVDLGRNPAIEVETNR